MKNEIQQILKMNKDGILTDEQAADLLAELAKSGPNSRTAPEFEWSETDLVKPFFAKVNSTLKTALDATFGGSSAFGRSDGPAATFPFGNTHFGADYANDIRNNAIHMSRVDSPKGESQIFAGNTIRMSAVRGLRLDRSEMRANTIDMSRVEGMTLRDGKLLESELRASSIVDLSLSESGLTALSIQGSKVQDFRVGKDCQLDSMRIQGSSCKGFLAEDRVRANAMLFNGAAISDLTLRRCEIAGAEFQASHISRLAYEDCGITNTLLRGMSVRDTSFVRCGFDDVLFSGIEKWGWKKRGLDDVRFEDCRLNKVLFSHCRFSKMVLKNISLNNHKFQDLDLSDMTLDGNEAFLAAVVAKR